MYRQHRQAFELRERLSTQAYFKRVKNPSEKWGFESSVSPCLKFRTPKKSKNPCEKWGYDEITKVENMQKPSRKVKTCREVCKTQHPKTLVKSGDTRPRDEMMNFQNTQKPLSKVGV